MQPSPAVRARAIEKRFGNVVALDGVDLDVPAGEIHGVVGPNGAGKTTLLSLLLGLGVADCGRLEILGTHLQRNVELSGVAGFVDGPAMYPSLTARQNLVAVAALRNTGGVRPNDVAEVLEQVGLTDVADDRVRGFSLGMRQRLGLAAALAAKPRLLVLDEPANGLDPAGKQHVHGLLRDLAARGTAVVLSSHDMDDVASLCAEVTLLACGRVVFSGPVTKLAAECGELDYRVVTSNAHAARDLAFVTPGLRLCAGLSAADQQPGAVLLRGSISSLDLLVFQLARAGVAVRELAPVTSPLEAAYLALTGQAEDLTR